MHPAPPGPAPPVDDARRVITFALLLGIFLAALDVLVVSPAMPSVVADLGGLALYPWVFSAYLLASTVAAPAWPRSGAPAARCTWRARSACWAAAWAWR